jgi:V-type H+-transporting ATPase subunit D
VWGRTQLCHAHVADRSEEFFRLKKVQGKKKRDAAKANEERAEKNAGVEEVHKDDGIGGGAAGGADMLDADKDDDVIF